MMVGVRWTVSPLDVTWKMREKGDGGRGRGKREGQEGGAVMRSLSITI